MQPKTCLALCKNSGKIFQMIKSVTILDFFWNQTLYISNSEECTGIQIERVFRVRLVKSSQTLRKATNQISFNIKIAASSHYNCLCRNPKLTVYSNAIFTNVYLLQLAAKHSKNK